MSARRTITAASTSGLITAVAIVSLLSGCATRPSGPENPDQVHALPPAAATEWPPLEPPLKNDRPLDFTSALDRALRISPTLRTLEAGYRSARLSARAAGDLRNPELRANYEERDGSFFDTEESPSTPSPARSERTDTSSERIDLAIRFFPPNPFTEGSARRSKSTFADAAALRIEKEKVLIADLLRSAWLSITYLTKDYSIIHDLYKGLDDSATAVSGLVEEGAATSLEAADAERTALRALLDLQDAETALAEAYEELARLLHMDAATLTLTGIEWTGPEIDPARLDREAISHLALQNALELAVLDREAEAAELAYIAARRAWIPWIQYVQFGITEADGSRSSMISEDQMRRRSSDDDGWDVSIALEIPLFSAFQSSPDLIKSQWEYLELQAMLGRELKVAEALRLVERLRRSSAHVTAFAARAEPAARRLQTILDQLAESQTYRPREQSQTGAQLLNLQRQRLRLEHNQRRDLLQLEAITGSSLSSWAIE